MHKTEWHEAGNAIYKSGHIERISIGWGWWLLDKWLAFGHPHWEWWDAAWSKLLPYWGDPFCAAYCTVWSNFYRRRVRSEHRIDVGFDALSADYRAWYADSMRDDHEANDNDVAA